jgi:hypothetical protein
VHATLWLSTHGDQRSKTGKLTELENRTDLEWSLWPSSAAGAAWPRAVAKSQSLLLMSYGHVAASATRTPCTGQPDFFNLFFVNFEKYMLHFARPYNMMFGSNRHIIRRLEVLQCSNHNIGGYCIACRVSSFTKSITFCMNSDGNKFYMKIVDFDEIYKFQMKKV